MEQKVKILSKYSIDAIDFDFEKKKAEANLKDSLESLGVTLGEIQRINSKKKKTKKEEILLSSFLEVEKQYSKRIEEINTYKEMIVSDVPEVTDLDQAVPYYEEKDGKVQMSWEIIKNEPLRVSQRINDLKRELSNSDYKIAKCYEASLLNQEMPYDIETLYHERQTKRDEINRLESSLPSDGGVLNATIS